MRTSVITVTDPDHKEKYYLYLHNAERPKRKKKLFGPSSLLDADTAQLITMFCGCLEEGAHHPRTLFLLNIDDSAKNTLPRTTINLLHDLLHFYNERTRAIDTLAKKGKGTGTPHQKRQRALRYLQERR